MHPGLLCFHIKHIASSSNGQTAEANKSLVPLFTEGAIIIPWNKRLKTCLCLKTVPTTLTQALLHLRALRVQGSSKAQLYLTCATRTLVLPEQQGCAHSSLSKDPHSCSYCSLAVLAHTIIRFTSAHISFPSLHRTGIAPASPQTPKPCDPHKACGMCQLFNSMWKM